MRKIVAIVGDAIIDPKSDKFKLAYETGKALVDNGYRVQSGGFRGVMEAAFMGARASEKYKEGDTIAILPSFDPALANDYADIIIPTGLDLYRNVIVASASAVIAIGGGAGTMCEITNAWALRRMVVAFDNVDGWSSKVAGAPVDHRNRYPDTIPDDRAYAVKNAQEALQYINERIHLYTTYHKGISPNS